MEGLVSWWDQVNEFADLPLDEFEQQKTGATDGSSYGRGLLQSSEEERVDERSERYFDTFRYNRAAAPSSYSAVDLGLVSPVKAQKSCGSCVAFSYVRWAAKSGESLTHESTYPYLNTNP